MQLSTYVWAFYRLEFFEGPVMSPFIIPYLWQRCFVRHVPCYRGFTAQQQSRRQKKRYPLALLASRAAITY